MSPRMSIIAVCAIVLAFCFGPAALAKKGDARQQGSNNGQPFQHLQAQIDELELSVQQLSVSLQLQIDELIQAQASQQELIGALIGAVATLEARVESNRADIEALSALQTFQEQLVDQLAAHYEDLEQRVGNNESEISILVQADQALQLLVFAIEGRVNTLQDRIAIMESEVGGLSGELSNLYGEVAILQDRLATLQQDLLDKQQRITQICPVGQAIRGINADGTVVCQLPPAGAGGGRLDRFVIERTTAIPVSTAVPRTGGGAVACPSGYSLSGGGYFLNADLGRGHVWRNYPVTTSTAHFWATIVKADGAPSRSLTVYAICQRLTN